MKKSMLIEQLIDAVKNERIYHGKKNMYDLAERVVAKIGWDECIKTEYRFNRILYKNGINVPEAYLVINDKSPLLECIKKPDNFFNYYMIMEKIIGKEVGKCEGAEKEEALRLYKREVRKILEMGIFPTDVLWKDNSIFGEDGKVYLIDFEAWEKGKTQAELMEFYEKINSPDLELSESRGEE